ncbi:MAG: AzlC family ABC transporter permease [Chitinophagales bacterium]
MKETTAPAGRVLAGLRISVPVILGYVPIGLAYGVLARQGGLTLLETVLMSLFVYAGSSQFIAVALWQAKAEPLAIIFTTFLVNLRHFLMSAALSPYLARYTKRWLAYFSYELTDETFALHSVNLRRGEAGYQGKTILAVNEASHLAWTTASAAGYLAGAVFGRPEALGFDFALPAMFIALLLMQVRRRLDLAVALLAAGLSLGLPYVIPGRWNVLIAAVAAAGAGALCAGPLPAEAAAEAGEAAASAEAGAGAAAGEDRAAVEGGQSRAV